MFEEIEGEFVDLINFKEGQKEIFINFLENEDVRYQLLLAYRRFGKTAVAVLIAMVAASMAVRLFDPTDKMDKLILRNDKMSRIFTIKMFSPFYNQASQSIWTEVETVALRWQKWEYQDEEGNVTTPFADIITISQRPMKITFEHQGRKCRIDFDALERNADGKRGAGADLVFCDEIADLHWDTIKTVVLPMLDDSQGFAFFFGTAKANYQTKMVKKAIDKLSKSIIMTTKLSEDLKNGHVSQQYYDDILERFDFDFNDPNYQQEYEAADSVPVKGAILSNWKREIAKNTKEEIAKMPTMISMDLGRLPYTIMVWALDVKNKNKPLIIIHWDEYFHDDASVENISHDMTFKYPNTVLVAIPHDGNTKSTTSVYSDHQIWSNCFSNVVLLDKVAKVQHRIRDAAEYANSVRILPDADDEMLMRLNNWSYNNDEDGWSDGKPLHDRNSHTGDAFNYGVIAYHKILDGSDKLQNFLIEKKLISPIDAMIMEMHNTAGEDSQNNSLIDAFEY